VVAAWRVVTAAVVAAVHPQHHQNKPLSAGEGASKPMKICWDEDDCHLWLFPVE